MTLSEIIVALENGAQFGNKNVSFINRDGEYIVCEMFHAENVKYVIFHDVKKFARRILKFYKTGY